MDEFGKIALREHEAMRISRRQWFWLHFTVWAAFDVFLFVVWLLTTRGWPWFLIPILAWGIVVAAHWAYAFLLRDPEEILMLREQRDRAERTAWSGADERDAWPGAHERDASVDAPAGTPPTSAAPPQAEQAR